MVEQKRMEENRAKTILLVGLILKTLEMNFH